MTISPLDLMEPEETVGNLWHGYASRLGATPIFEEAAVELRSVRSSLTLLFRALGGGEQVELAEAPLVRAQHRTGVARRIGTASEMLWLPSYDGERLRLAPKMNLFPSVELNRAIYFWQTALAAVARVPEKADHPLDHDRTQINVMARATEAALRLCPGLRAPFEEMCRFIVATRRSPMMPHAEAAIERAIIAQLSGDERVPLPEGPAPRGYCNFAPVPVWLTVTPPGEGNETTASGSEAEPPAGLATTTRKIGLRENRDEANRKDSFIIHRFEAILSWVESMNLNRSTDDDDDENAQKAAEDQNNITLSKHDRKAATRLRLHLDLSPQDADHERLSGEFTYPEWNHRTRSYLPDHCRVLEADAQTDAQMTLPDARRMREVRRQFEALRPRRILRPRQIEGAELDLDALISAQVELKATGRSTDRIYQSLRQIDRDLSVAFLLDTSRSTEAAVGDTCVIDVARDALSALAGGIDASGDRLGIWGFSSLRRDRVFLSRCKDFDVPMSPDVTQRICSLRPGHYTRLGAAVRHVSAMLDREGSTRKLLIILTDGKPNDLDHYEGQHGIEDSHMAVREARRLGQTVYGIVVDEDGQDWFARIFGRGGFTLLPEPARLTRALPDIYRALIQEN